MLAVEAAGGRGNRLLAPRPKQNRNVAPIGPPS
jgi:hypothetical protein